MDDKEVPVNSSFAPSSQDGKGVVSDNSFSENEQQGKLDYPEGGLQAWLVVSGSAAIMFCTFGYLTGFGYVNKL